jgi:hypothetical protein
MKVSETTLASDSKAIIDNVLAGHESVEVHRHGRTVVQIRSKVGISAAELIERLKQEQFTPAEQNELKVAMNAANDVFAHADRR